MCAQTLAKESGNSERNGVGGRSTSPNSLVFMRFIYLTSNEVRARSVFATWRLWQRHLRCLSASF
jgi:hypothetical protein